MRGRGVVATAIGAVTALVVGLVVWVGYQPAPAATPRLVFPGQSVDAAARTVGHLLVPEDDIEVERDPIPTSPDTRAAFEARYPRQAAADRRSGPGGDHWALLIGINEHIGAVSNNYVSREDAERLREVLLRAGWDDDRIVLMTDRDATGAMIREGLSWLARKSGDGSTVVFHYSGHSKKWYGSGGVILDEAMWPTDDDFVRREELAASMAEVRHAQLWGNVATCNAEGFHEAGLGAPGRVWTYSSREPEKSYEDPDAGHSVWGSFLIHQALDRGAQARDGVPPSVQDAFAFAAPLAHQRTVGQVPYGPQTPVMIDDLGRPFDLRADVGAVMSAER